MTSTDVLLNDFAVRSFRDIADGDYIAARLAIRHQLVPQFLWQSLQAIEKYFKCILVLNRIKAENIHHLRPLLEKFQSANLFQVRISSETDTFISFLDKYGRFRYFESSYGASTDHLFQLDRAVWEIRRYARVMNSRLKLDDGSYKDMLQLELSRNERAEERPPQEYAVFNGQLEQILRKKTHPSRSALVWNNLYYGSSRRRTVRYRSTSTGANSPLSLRPGLLDEVLKYVYLPGYVQDAYRKSKR